MLRRRTVRSAGALRSEDAGISSDKQGENPCRQKPKVSWAMFVSSGLVGPKLRPKGVSKGHPVNIPELR
jgi:hypothetical protein